MSIRVFVVAGVRLYREGLARWLPASGKLEVVGSECSLDAAVERIMAAHPDVLLSELRSPQEFVIATALHDALPDLKLMALGLSETEDQVLACAEAGVVGYLSSETSL